MLSLVVFPASRCVMVCPPNLCGWWYLTWVWVRGVGDGAPPMILSSSMRFHHTTVSSRCIFGTLDSPQ